MENGNNDLNEVFSPDAPAETVEQSMPAAETPAPAGDQQQPQQPEPEGWTYQAYKSEKHKRQELERQIEELRRQQPQQQEQQPDEFWLDPEKHINSARESTVKATRIASEAKCIAMHGADFYKEMDGALQKAIDSKDPEIPFLYEQVMQSGDPAEVVRSWYLAHQKKAEQQNIKLPTSLDNVRNVSRNVRVSDEDSLEDIFDRRRAS